MMKPLFYFVLLSSIYMNAQTTIVEEKFTDDSTPMRYHYLPKSNKIVIEKGSYVFRSFNRRINNISSYDYYGKKEILVNNFECLLSDFSITENTFLLDDFSKYGNQSYKYVVNGKQTPTLNYSDVSRNYGDRIFNVNDLNYTFGKKYFNDKYELDIVDEKGKNKVNFEKDELYLEILDFFSKDKRIIPIIKPDLNRLLNEQSIKIEEFLGYAANLIDNDKFEIITKSISKDYKSSILFRTFYNMDGKIIGEQKLNISLPSEYLVYSANNAARINAKFGSRNATPLFLTDLAINDFIVDNITKDIYVFGLFGDKAKKLNDDNSPSGYYVFKFDKEGKKVWESINRIDDKDDFNKKNHLVKVFSSLSFSSNNLLFETGGRFKENYFHYSFIDKNTGKILNKNKISYEEDRIYTFKGDYRAFILTFNECEGYKNKVFDNDGLVAIDTNKKVVEYLKNINTKNKLFFNTIFSNDGIWLLESDNKEYYKVTFFKT